MKDKINIICTELNDGKIAVVQATEKLFDLYSVSNQRELLIAFKEYLIELTMDLDSYTDKDILDDFESNL